MHLEKLVFSCKFAPINFMGYLKFVKKICKQRFLLRNSNH